ncbi:MAG TPA: ABC transporter ATP-binding protein [Gammaproteobacteria bacterium]|nr:ABC transporter ATP-binding protein [Gammaproteobacteria bacterium]
MSDAKPLLAARGLERRYGGRVAVTGLDLQLRAGQVLGLLGPNGAGKTTTLEMLSGLLSPHAGTVRIGGLDPFRDSVRTSALIGYMPEHPPLYPELTVDEFLDYCAGLRAVPRRERRTAVERVKRECRLADVGVRRAGRLSRGYQQRLGIAQAIIHDPPVVILDEPTIGLDPRQIREVRELIGRLACGRGVLLSSHNLSEVEASCTDVAILFRGRLVYAGPVRPEDGGRRWRVGLRRPPADTAELERLPGVRTAVALDESRYELECTDDPSEGLVRTSLERGWDLFEIHPVSRTLEQRFLELTEEREPGEPAP